MTRFLFVCTFFLLLSCKNDVAVANAGEETAQNVDANTEKIQVQSVEQAETAEKEVEIEKPKSTAKKSEKKERQAAAKFEFRSKKYEFGMAEEGRIIKHSFYFTNTGSIPLQITNATSTCGCTIPEWPKEPIPPGGSGKIDATFDTTGKLGSQNKEITITANTNPKTTKVALVGFIGTAEAEKEKADKKANAAKKDSI